MLTHILRVLVFGFLLTLILNLLPSLPCSMWSYGPSDVHPHNIHVLPQPSHPTAESSNCQRHAEHTSHIAQTLATPQSCQHLHPKCCPHLQLSPSNVRHISVQVCHATDQQQLLNVRLSGDLKTVAAILQPAVLRGGSQARCGCIL